MTDLWVVLFGKATVVVAAAAVTALAMRRASAAARHLVWLTAVVSVLLLPAGSLMPAVSAETPVVLSVTAVPGAARAGSFPAPVVGLWAIGCLLLLARLATSAFRVTRLLRRAEPAWAGVRVVRDLAGPAACGFGSVVLVPPGWTVWPEERRRAVLLHENAHLSRRDSWSLLLAEMACALYWPNPLVWVAAARLRREQEHAADDSVLRAGFDAAEYAAHLVAVARCERSPALLAGAVTRCDLPSRVEAILDTRRSRSMITKSKMCGAVAALLFISLPLAALQNQKKSYKVGEDGVTAPVVTYKVEPSYTESAKEARIEGSVELSMVVEADGNPYDVQVVQGLEPGLDANAVEAISAWRFKPGEKDGKPVPVKAKIMVNYRLL